MLNIKKEVYCHIILNIYLDNDFKFQHKTLSSLTIKDLKTIILNKLGLYSVNYLIHYQDRDYTNFDTFKLKEIFFLDLKGIDSEYKINLIDIETFVKQRQSTRVLIAYEEGGDIFYIYNLKTKNFSKNDFKKSDRIKFEKFPYNSRSCHVKKENKLVISGGVNFEKSICSYDYDLNFLNDHDNLEFDRQQHSMVNVKDCIFIIGGTFSKKVECFDLFYEDLKQYPEMKYDRKDPSVCVVNDKFLYVFMGFSSQVGDIARNFEKLDITQQPFDCDWNLLPIHDYNDRSLKSLSAVVSFEKGFLFLGGFIKGSSHHGVNFLDMEDYCFKTSRFRLPYESAFAEKAMFSIDDKDFYLFTYGTMKLITYSVKLQTIHDVLL